MPNLLAVSQIPENITFRDMKLTLKKKRNNIIIFKKTFLAGTHRRHIFMSKYQIPKIK